jgi:hypothetical protein
LKLFMTPAGERKVERFGWTFAPGEKVMKVDDAMATCRRTWYWPNVASTRMHLFGGDTDGEPR